MVFKCKMCGGELNIDSNNNICICQYCGTKQTVPNVDTEIEKQLFDRANYYRFSNEFDRALTIYEQILEKNPKEPEAFWGVLLCRYGVEYVEDSKTKERIPTCHRTCYESILNDLNYKSALKYATSEAAKIYQKEAIYIDNVQKKIKEISSKENPFDIFICYKESNGDDRTIDSVIAEEIYENLTKKGYKVFFSRISLEGKLGVEYEPYIYAALTSAKVMLVVGSSKDNMNSVWVRNEWNRYLALIKEGKEKTLIPCYKEMNPYEMPDEFSALQAQNMDKVGAMQDLLRGIDKIIKPSENEIDATTVDSHILKKSLEKAFEYLQQGKWGEARKRLDNAKDYDSHSAMVYLGYLLIDLKIKNLEELENYPNNYFNNENYKMALKYADKKLASTLEKYKENTQKILEEKDKEYKQKEVKLKKIAIIVLSIVAVILAIILVITKIIIPNNQYADTVELMNQGDYEIAYEKFDDIIHIKDSNDKKLDCIIQIQLNSIKEDSKNELDVRFIQNLDKLGNERIYTIAKAYYEEENLQKFEELYEYIKGYEDSDKLYMETTYKNGMNSYKSGNIEKSLKILTQAQDLGHEGAKTELEKIKKQVYDKAMKEYNKTNYGTAKDTFAVITEYNYKDSKDKYNSCIKKINSEKEKYYGTWIESQNFWTNLKIDQTGIYHASQIDTKRDEWQLIGGALYNEDTATYSFDYWDGHSYNVKVTGNRLTLTCTNLKDKYDDDWFKDYNIFYKK